MKYESSKNWWTRLHIFFTFPRWYTCQGYNSYDELANTSMSKRANNTLSYGTYFILNIFLNVYNIIIVYHNDNYNAFRLNQKCKANKIWK